MLADTALAALTLGVPVMILSWLILSRLSARSLIDLHADDKQMKRDMKRLRKEKPEEQGFLWQVLQSRWMLFGGGFYGVAALWTFAVLEVQQLFELVTNFPGWAALLAPGLINALVNLFVNQMLTMVSAFTWFTHWGSQGTGVPINFAIAWGGYTVGLMAARTLGPMRV